MADASGKDGRFAERLDNAMDAEIRKRGNDACGELHAFCPERR